MKADPAAPRDRHPDWVPVADPGHPRGTLAIVLVYALLFAAGWLALWLGAFLPRGAPHP